MTMRDQTQDAQILYDDRAVHYDGSWHPQFARHMVDLAQLQEGDDVLDLACGTGLVSFPASAAVGPRGSVTAVDISSGMLAEAEKKKSTNGGGNSNVHFYQHSIVELDTLEALQDGRQFDAIICASALVLLQRPQKAVQHWVSFLKPGGRLVIDSTHPRSQLPEITFERVSIALGKTIPWYRTWSQSPDDLRAMMETAGLQDLSVILMSQMPLGGADGMKDYIHDVKNPRIERVYEVTDAERLFNDRIDKWAYQDMAGAETRSRAQEPFVDEWRKLANADGKIREVDGVFVGIGRKL